MEHSKGCKLQETGRYTENCAGCLEEARAFSNREMRQSAKCNKCGFVSKDAAGCSHASCGGIFITEPWTAETVRQELPDVQVRWGRKVITGIVCGRKNEYATVRPSIAMLYGSALSWTFSWDAIAHSLNSGTPLVGGSL